MKINYLGSILFFLSAHSFGGQLLPHHPQSVESYIDGKDILEEKARLKISLVTTSDSVEKGVKVGGVVVCSEKACYKPTTPNYIDLRNTSKNDVAVVADFSIPLTTIRSIHFIDTVGGVIVDGSLVLQKAIQLEKGYHGNALMVLLEKKGAGNKTIYFPSQSASSKISKVANSVYYIPSVTTVANLPNNVIFTLPAGSLAQPQIFNVSTLDVGNKFPLVDIFPYVDLSIPASLEVSENSFKKLSITNNSVVATPAPSPVYPNGNVVDRSLSSGNESNKAKISFSKTGVFESNAFKNEGGDVKSKRQGNITLASTQQCLAMLNNPANIQAIQSATATNGVVYVNWCENIAPYVIIAYINLDDPRTKYKIPAEDAAADYVMKLKKITDFGPSIVSINGFVWTGDEGTGDNQKGKVNGYVYSTVKTWIGGNCIIGGFCSLYDGTKFAMAITGNTPPYQINYSLASDYVSGPTGVVLGNNGYAKVVSSSTSVVRDGICATPGTENRWSAIGAAPGKMVMISSTSSGTTSAAELCPIFQAFQINNALRMDGGPSTAMLIDGVLKNPLTGLAQIKYGTLRRIPYPLQITK